MILITILDEFINQLITRGPHIVVYVSHNIHKQLLFTEQWLRTDNLEYVLLFSIACRLKLPPWTSIDYTKLLLFNLLIGPLSLIKTWVLCRRVIPSLPRHTKASAPKHLGFLRSVILLVLLPKNYTSSRVMIAVAAQSRKGFSTTLLFLFQTSKCA